jgi:hypothetical protein
MKKQILKRVAKSMMIIAMAMLVVVACKKDETTDEPGTTPVEDGIYVTGAATGVATPGINGLMSTARNEVTQEDRAELKEIYMAVSATDGFNIVMVSGSTTKTYGPGADFAMVDAANLDNDEPKNGLWRGSLVETTDKFTVPEDGLYHIAFDQELMIVVIAKADWGIIGGATPGGWGDNTVMVSGGFDKNAMSFEIAEVTLLENEWKFRYSNGWKIILDPDFDLGGGVVGIKVNSNFGGAADALVAGGANIANDTYGNYKVTMNWALGTGMTAAIEWVGDAIPLPEFPEKMYIVGAGTAYGWDTPGTVDAAIMHKCAGGAPSEGLFWKICYLEAGQGFKVSDSAWGAYNFGFDQIEEFDADGVAVTSLDGNMDIAASGMYIVVLNLRDDAIKLSIKTAEVYGMGDAFDATGTWIEDNPLGLFTIDNVAKTLTSPALVADANIRMYAQHTWIPDWWNAEFNVYSGVIEYRNDGGDQEAVAGATGQVITLTFDDNTGDIQ